MKMLRRVLMVGLLVTMVGAVQAERLKVVATFSVLGDMVSEIAADRVDLNVLVGPNGDTHLFEPSPADLVAVSQADLVVMNGLGFEGWLPRLLENGGFAGRRLVTGEHIEPLEFTGDEHHHDDHDTDQDQDEHGSEESHETYDPHAWHSLPNGVRYANAIANALVELDPANADFYRQRVQDYVARLEVLHQWADSVLAGIPDSHRRMITPHDAFGYLAHEYGLHIEAPQGLSTESEASAGHVGELIRQVRQNRIAAVFLENIASEAMVRQIQRETQVQLGGTLYSDALSEPDGPAGTYEAMMQHNLETILNSLWVISGEG